MTLHVKIAMSDLQRYPWNLILIKNVEDTVARPLNVQADIFVAAHLTPEKIRLRVVEIQKFCLNASLFSLKQCLFLWVSRYLLLVKNMHI